MLTVSNIKKVNSLLNKEFLIALIGWSLFALFAFVNRHKGISYFDSSEFAIHIADGGIAHAPGYPLYILLGKFFYFFKKDAFFAQFLISILSSLFVTVFIFLSLSRIPSDLNRLIAALSCLLFLSGYYIKLYTLLPEVFLLNCAIFSFLAWGISLARPQKLKASGGVIGLALGLGISHHHMILLAVVPALLALLPILRRTQFKEIYQALLISIFSLLIGILPSTYLFFAAESEAMFTYFKVKNFDGYLYVLLRKGYGTFQLTNLPKNVSLQDIYLLFINGIIKNFNLINTIYFLPLLLLIFRPRRLLSVIKTEPLFLFSLGCILFFIFLFLPLSNIPLKSELYKNILLRFITLPALLLVYPFAVSMRQIKTKIINYYSVALLIVIVACSNFFTANELNFSNDKLLEKHLEASFETAERLTKNLPSGEVGEKHNRCILFAAPDAIINGAHFYNQFYATRKCYIYGLSGISNTFVGKNEDQLARLIFNPLEYSRVETVLNKSSLSEVFDIFFNRLYERGYKIFLLFPSPLLEDKKWKYYPEGNILELRPEKAPVITQVTLELEYRTYRDMLKIYFQDIKDRPVSVTLLDESVQQAMLLNLHYYHYFLNLTKR